MANSIKGVVTIGGLSLLLFVSGLLIWLTPLPVFYAYRQQGRNAALAALVFSLVGLVLLYFVFVPWMLATLGIEKSLQYLFWIPGLAALQGVPWNPGWFGLGYFLYYALMGLLLGFWEPREGNLTRLVAKMLSILAAFIFLWLLWETRASFTTLFQQMENYFREFLQQMSQLPADTGPEIRDQLAVFHSYGDTIVYYAVRLAPGMMLAMMIFILWLNIVVARKLFIRCSFFKKLGPLRNWQLPFEFVWALIAFAGLLMLDLYFLKIEFLKLIALNIFIVFSLVYFFQGLAILAFYGRKWAIHPLVKLLFYVIFLIFFQPIGVLLLAIGFFDSWFDFRKLTPKAASS